MSAVKRYISDLCDKFGCDETAMPILENTTFTVAGKSLQNVISYSINHDERDMFCTINLERKDGKEILSETYLLGEIGTTNIITNFKLMKAREVPKTFTNRAIDTFSLIRRLGTDKLTEILEVASAALDNRTPVSFTYEDLKDFAVATGIKVPVVNKPIELVN